MNMLPIKHFHQLLTIIALLPVLRIRIRSAPELCPCSGSGIIITDPYPAKKWKSVYIKLWILNLFYFCTVPSVLKIEGKIIIVNFFFLIELNFFLGIILKCRYFINIGWILHLIRMDPVLLPWSWYGTRKIKNWIRIWNKIIPNPQHCLLQCHQLHFPVVFDINIKII